MRNSIFWGGFLGILLVYILGLFNTLMENDSAQFAVMALRMVQENDFLNLIKGTEEYLDKPHMHYWLAALSFKIFGISDWAYRIPALLATLLGAYSCYGFGKLLFTRDTGKLAALIFLSAQTIVLSVIDVRTDAVLTGFSILALWQLTDYFRSGRLKAVLIGAVAAGVAFSTKGQIALVVIGLPLLFELLQNKSWNRLLDYKVILALLTFALVISPMLYAYYHQFDLHPEKIIRGRGQRSGILFILWEQSFERMSGSGVGKNSSDYFFFFHTFLWVFLPWTLLGLVAMGKALKALFKGPERKISSKGTALLPGGILSIFLLISFAQFKLPHYLNITIPLFAVLTANFIFSNLEQERFKGFRLWAGLQGFIFSVVLIAVTLLGFLVFPEPFFWSIAVLILGVGILVLYFAKQWRQEERIILLALAGSVLLNLFLNGHFYPNLLKYQAGSTLAEKVVELENPPIYKLNEGHSWAMDFYTGSPVTHYNPAQVSDLDGKWLYVTDSELRTLEKQELGWSEIYSAKHFRITRLQMRFLNPKTRDSVIDYRHLIRLKVP